MKTKYYIRILSALLFAAMPVKAQYSDNVYHGNHEAMIIVNNYYDDYDYYYSSRINRFHRSYTEFTYYSPFFTELYWYTYSPVSLGISIYSDGPGFTIGYNFSYPVYYSHFYRGYTPYFYNTFYWGYDPFYWYNPFIFSVNFNNNWDHHYWGWNHHYFRDCYYRCIDYRPVYYSSHSDSYRDYRSINYTTMNDNTFSGSRRQTSDNTIRQGTAISSDTRRSSEERSSTMAITSKNTALRSNINNQTDSRRSSTQISTRSSGMKNQVSTPRATYQASAGGIPVNNNSEHRRSINQPVSRSSNADQTAKRIDAPDYKNQSRSITALSRPSNNTGNQSFEGRRPTVSSSAQLQNRPVSASPRNYTSTRREGTLSQNLNSSKPESRLSEKNNSRSGKDGSRE
jgi:hypothetical protein